MHRGNALLESRRHLETFGGARERGIERGSKERARSPDDERRVVAADEKVAGWSREDMELEFKKAFSRADLDSNDNIDFEEFKKCIFSVRVDVLGLPKHPHRPKCCVLIWPKK